MTHWTCPECSATNPREEWRECEVYCEDCGDHPGIQCPACGHRFDMVYNDEDRVREASRTQGR